MFLFLCFICSGFGNSLVSLSSELNVYKESNTFLYASLISIKHFPLEKHIPFVLVEPVFRFRGVYLKPGVIFSKESTNTPGFGGSVSLPFYRSDNLLLVSSYGVLLPVRFFPGDLNFTYDLKILQGVSGRVNIFYSFLGLKFASGADMTVSHSWYEHINDKMGEEKNYNDFAFSFKIDTDIKLFKVRNIGINFGLRTEVYPDLKFLPHLYLNR